MLCLRACVHVNSSHGQTKRKPRCTQTNSHSHTYSLSLSLFLSPLCLCVSVPMHAAVAAKYATGNFQFHAPSSFTFIAHCPSHALPRKARGWPERKIELFIWLRLSYLKLFYVPLSQRKLFQQHKRKTDPVVESGSA